MPVIRVAQAQINPTVGDFSGNVAKMIDCLERARDQQAAIVTFPELALCGYPPEDLLLRPGFLRDTQQALQRLTPHTRDLVAVTGFAQSDGSHVFNAAAVLQDGELAAVYRKAELPNYGVFDEKRYFAAGEQQQLFELNGLRFSITVCEDIWIADSPSELAARAGRADFVLNLSASPFHAGKLATRYQIARRFAAATGALLCLNNLVGGQDELVFDGGSFVMTPQGEIIARAPRFEEALLVGDLPVRDPSLRSRNPVPAAPRSPEPLRLRPLPCTAEPLPPPLAPESDRLEEICRALTLGTSDYVRKNGFEKVVLGLSGGIDSALTAAIAAAALGRQNVVGVTMPSRFTSAGTRSDAERLAANLGIRLITLPLDEIYQAYLSVLDEPFGRVPPGVPHENIQARIRGNLLMALSNRFGWLVLTTGNKSEVAVGYCTLYGDMAGGFSIIKDVPKAMVYELSEHVNALHGREIIPASVLRRPPSAELRPDQKDEDSLPPYSLLDPILELYVEEDRSPEDIARAGFDSNLVTEVIRMVDQSEYKRRQAAPGIKITPKAFGRDRRLPITNRYWKYLQHVAVSNEFK